MIRQWKLYGWNETVPNYKEFYYNSFDHVAQQTHNWGYDYFYKENYHFPYSDTQSIYEMWDCHIKEGDVIVDLGANVGFFTRHAAEKGAIVISIEGAPEIYSCLIENTHDLPNVHCMNAIVIGSKATSNVWSPKSSFTPTVTLQEIMDIYALEKINFLKCDIEGGEYDLFSHTPQSVWDSIERVSLEPHGIEEQMWSLNIPGKQREHFLYNNSPMFYFKPQ